MSDEQRMEVEALAFKILPLFNGLQPTVVALALVEVAASLHVAHAHQGRLEAAAADFATLFLLRCAEMSKRADETPIQ